MLEALVELRGLTSMLKVLELVEKKMRNNNIIRWKNTAQWCRNTMVQEGWASGKLHFLVPKK